MLNIETPRLVLRKLVDTDAAFILELVNDPDWLRYIGDRKVNSIEDAIGYIQNGPRTSYVEHGFGLLVMTERDVGRPLGLCGLLKRDYLASPDIGYALLPEARGKGYATEAVLAVLLAAKHKGVKQVSALVTPGNDASIAVLESVGMQDRGEIMAEGTLPSRLFSIELAAVQS